MKTMMIAAVLAVLPMAATAQTAPTGATGATGIGEPIEAPVLAGATLDATCGNLYDMAGRAFCVTAPLASIGAIADAYIAHFEGEGWIAAAGDDNRVVFVKRRDGGGCDGLQVQAFYDPNRPAGPEVPGYLAMATIPGDVCAAAPAAAPATPPAP
jgi:hypothetical protein